MTAETLKPFITPQSIDNFPATTHSSAKRRQKSLNFLAIGLGVLSLVLITTLLAFSIWNTLRISNLETEIRNLHNVVDNIKQHLGPQYTDDVEDFKNEYLNAIVDKDAKDYEDEDELENESNENINSEDVKKDSRHNRDDDDDMNVDEDEDYDSSQDDYNSKESYGYEDLLQQFKQDLSNIDNEDDNVNGENSDDVSDDDSLIDDLKRFQDSKKKNISRQERSIESTPLVASEEIKLTQFDKTTTKPAMQEQETNHYSTTTQANNIRPLKKRLPSSSESIVSEDKQHNRHTMLRPRTHRRHKFPMHKSDESLISAKSTAYINNVAASSSSSSSSKPAAHFHLNNKIPDRHAAIKVHSYPGDMYIGHPSATNDVETEKYFKVDNGVLRVLEHGLYYIYAQVCYNNTHDQNGFVIFHGHKPFLQCLNTVPTNLPLKIHTCHTSGLIHLRTNDTIHLRDFHSDRNVILKDTNNRSYFGLIKI